jgi:hypothetical protein
VVWTINAPEIVLKDKRTITAKPTGDMSRTEDALRYSSEPGMDFELYRRSSGGHILRNKAGWRKSACFTNRSYSNVEAELHSPCLSGRILVPVEVISHTRGDSSPTRPARATQWPCSARSRARPCW